LTEPAIPGLMRHFCTLSDRQIHYRRSGVGPALIALHRLPRSSKDLKAFTLAAAKTFTVIAPDIAGYGNTWHLSNDNGLLEDYAADIEALLDALGVPQASLYGEGEGAALAILLAHRNPKRFTGVVAHDLRMALPSDAQQAMNVLQKFIPAWDGSHLAWLWAFLREENCFSPWWTKSLATRLDADMPSPEELQSRAIQFLADGRLAPSALGAAAGRQGRAYHRGIAAALSFDVRKALNGLSVPTLIVQRRRPEPANTQYPAHCQYVEESRREVAYDESIAFLRARTAGSPAVGPSPAPRPIAGALWQDFVSVPGGQMHVQMNGDQSTIPLLVQHDAASSMSTVEPITQTFIGQRTVLAFDLPGSGDSDNTVGQLNADVGMYADALRQALLSMGLDQVDFYGMWGGGFVGLDLALRDRQRVRRLVMSNVFEHRGEEQRLIQANYTPDVSPIWHGGHLLQCWHQMRDQGIYYPWFDRTAKGVIPREPFLATDMVHERVCSLLKAGNMYRTAYQAHFAYPTYAKLRSSPVPTLVATTEWDPNNAHTQEAAAAAVNVRFQYLDEDFAKWGLSFLPFLDAEAT
jgi:pimeloyl-ACP methyl ester carboxylesterase